MSTSDGSEGAARLAAAGVTVGADVRAWLGDDVTLGAGVSIGDGAVLVARSLHLGDGVRIAAGADIRSDRVELGVRTEIGAAVGVLVSDEFTVGPAGRIEDHTSITCRSFRAGRLFYLGHDSSVGYGGTMTSTARFTAGDQVALGPHSILNANHAIELEDQVGSGAYLSIWTHGFHFGHRLLDGYGTAFAPVHIERNVWLGYHVTVLPGVRIGPDTILAAGAVASRNLPGGVLAAGVPAVVKRPLAPAAITGDEAYARVVALVADWVEELRWKEIPVEIDADGTVVLHGIRVVVHPPGGPLPGDESRRTIMLSTEPVDAAAVGAELLVFDLRTGVLHGTLDEIGHDLRDFLRRSALPCGDAEPFQSLPPSGFERLRNPELSARYRVGSS